MRRLDYLDSLGIETIWLAPFQCSPNRDNGYDISDFYAVDPSHGTGGDFVEFMHQDAYGYHWFRVGGTNYVLRRERA